MEMVIQVVYYMQRIGKQTKTGKINRTAHFKLLSQQKGQAGGHLLTRASTAIDSADYQDIYILHL